MDNDVQGTEYCIGFSSAITRAKELINRQRTTLGSHERIGVFRIFGRDAGFSALFTAYVTSGALPDPRGAVRPGAAGRDPRRGPPANPSRYAFVITAEGAMWEGGSLAEYGEADAFGHRHKVNVGEALAAEIRARTGIETVSSELTYDLRSGEADSLDQMVAMTFANVAMDLIADGQPAGWSRSATATTPTRRCPTRASGHARSTSPRLYDMERFRPTYVGQARRADAAARDAGAGARLIRATADLAGTAGGRTARRLRPAARSAHGSRARPPRCRPRRGRRRRARARSPRTGR